MESLFAWLYGALVAAPAVALSASFGWGILSVLLSPCHLASIPLIVGFIGGRARTPRRTAFVLALLFATGILVTISLIGFATGLAGRMLGDTGSWGAYAVGLLFIAVGLHFLGILPLPLPEPGQPAFARKGAFAAFAFGLIYGVALGPCTFAFMAPVLGTAFATASANLLFGSLLVGAYAAGHCAVIVGAGTFVPVVQAYLDWNGRSRAASTVRRICGVLVAMGGIYLMVTAK